MAAVAIRLRHSRQPFFNLLIGADCEAADLRAGENILQLHVAAGAQNREARARLRYEAE